MTGSNPGLKSVRILREGVIGDSSWRRTDGHRASPPTGLSNLLTHFELQKRQKFLYSKAKFESSLKNWVVCVSTNDAMDHLKLWMTHIRL